MLLAELAEAVLLIALSQPQPVPEPTVPVILHPDLPIFVMTVRHAERRLATETDPKWRAALVWALGTRPDKPKCITWEQHVAETASWYRAPKREYVSCGDARVGPPGGK
jgi:hypothetical protein